ncbi:MAG: hypothetical protein Q7T50_01885 [Candidatus Magasanikbacteria bacterium]|nr:hypothetical protein [Candidatus Magasanikbacteria bacterium]
MPIFTKYAEQKFDILNKHKVFITREQIEDVLRIPDKTEKRKKHFFAEKDGIKVVYQKENEIIKIVTFYPTKN